MSMMKKASIVLVVLMFGVLSVAFAEEKGEKLFVNLTSNEMNRAAMAINFSDRILNAKKIPVTIFLNVDGVRLVNRHIPGHKHASGQTLQEMLTGFMKSGGLVIACPMCMKNVGGMTKDDLMEGVVVGSSDVTWPALFAKGTTVLNY